MQPEIILAYPRDLMVPGDILVKVGHVAIVQEVEFMTGTRFLGVDYLNKVKMIHSTGSQFTWRVRNDQKWGTLGSSYIPKRLIIEN